MSSTLRCGLLALGVWLAPSLQGLSAQDPPRPGTGRRPASDEELRGWLINILIRHRFTPEEAAAALDMSVDEVLRVAKRLDVSSMPSRTTTPSGVLEVLPYPGGRHPRIGFLEGAIDPQRETKVSVFTPWQDDTGSRADYVVVDVPEAIWSNLGLTYLAHTHVPTIWTTAQIPLQPLEWQRRSEGSLFLERKLPNGIVFTALVTPKADHCAMTLTLTNGTDQLLTDLRVQICVMLKGTAGFTQPSNDNKRFEEPYAAGHDDSGQRWIITAWTPHHRSWGNARCPCLHSDPKFPDCSPGETVTVQGWLSFYTGRAIDDELARIDRLHWWERH